MRGRLPCVRLRARVPVLVGSDPCRGAYQELLPGDKGPASHRHRAGADKAKLAKHPKLQIAWAELGELLQLLLVMDGERVNPKRLADATHAVPAKTGLRQQGEVQQRRRPLQIGDRRSVIRIAVIRIRAVADVHPRVPAPGDATIGETPASETKANSETDGPTPTAPAPAPSAAAPSSADPRSARNRKASPDRAGRETRSDRCEAAPETRSGCGKPTKPCTRRSVNQVVPRALSHSTSWLACPGC